MIARRSAGPADRLVCDGADVQAGETVWWSGEFQVGEVWGEGPERRAQFPSGEVGADAEVFAVSEGEVVVRGAAHVEPVRVGELALIAVA